MAAVIKAIKKLDTLIGKTIKFCDKHDFELLITADHGNSEYMLDLKTGEPITSHSTFDVPIIVISDRVKNIDHGRLSDIAPTMLHLMGLEIPKEMTGKSVVEL